MTPLDEAPEQRWRRTVDRRNRPAKLKVDRLLRDFGYAELDPEVGDAIEARLAGVALAVAPSLRDASRRRGRDDLRQRQRRPDAGRARGAPREPSRRRAPRRRSPSPSDVAQMVTYLKQQVLDARAEAERLRDELDRRIAARDGRRVARHRGDHRRAGRRAAGAEPPDRRARRRAGPARARRWPRRATRSAARSASCRRCPSRRRAEAELLPFAAGDAPPPPTRPRVRRRRSPVSSGEECDRRPRGGRGRLAGIRIRSPPSR